MRGKKFRRNSMAGTVLRIVAAAAATGIVIAAFATAPGLALVVREFLNETEDWSRQARWRKQQRIREAIRRLARRRLVRYEERGKETFLVITKGGVSAVKRFDFEELRIESPSRWDGKWRMIIFDIPEKQRSGREALRRKLHTLGFLALQKSVFVFPYECHDEADFVANFCGVERFIVYCTSTDLGQDEIRARKHFGLLLAEA